MIPRKLSFSQCRTVFPTICLCDKTNYTCSKIGICCRGYRPITAHAAPPVFYRLSSQLKNNCSLIPRVLQHDAVADTTVVLPRSLLALKHIPAVPRGTLYSPCDSPPVFHSQDTAVLLKHNHYTWFLVLHTAQILRILFERKELRINKKLSFFQCFFQIIDFLAFPPNRANPPFCPSIIIFSQIPNKGIFFDRSTVVCPSGNHFRSHMDFAS